MYHYLIHIIPKNIVEQGTEVIYEYHKKFCTEAYLEPDTEYPKNGTREIYKTCTELKKEFNDLEDNEYISWLDYVCNLVSDIGETAALDEEETLL